MAADAPPLPPERITRIAPFTKRSYATPARLAVEAAPEPPPQE